MKWVKYYSLLTFLFVFQTVLGDSIKIAGMLPDLIFILTVYVSLKEKRPYCLVFALVSGLLKDFSLMQTFGLNAIITLYISFFISLIAEKYFYPTIFVNGMFTFFGSFLWQLSYFFLKFTMWGEERLLYPVINIILPQCVYNTVLSFLVFWLCNLMCKEKVFSLKTFRRGSK